MAKEYFNLNLKDTKDNGNKTVKKDMENIKFSQLVKSLKEILWITNFKDKAP